MSKVQLPFGMKDYLPEECYNKEMAQQKLAKVFASYGYKAVSMPALEYSELFTADGAMSVNKLFKLTDTDGSLLALRGDATIQVCRMYVTNMTGLQRMYYSLDSFEFLKDVNSSRDREFAQMGVELLGDSGEAGETELLCMAVDALKNAGLKNFKIEIGHVGYIEGLAEQYGIKGEKITQLKQLLNKKDMLGIELFFMDSNLNEDIKSIFLELPLLFGDKTILDKAAKLCNNEKSKAALERLGSLLSKLEEAGLGEYFSLDLSIVSCNNYYTGIVFKGITEGVGSSILDGGRYDNLCDRMGKATNAVGFAIGMRRLLSALKKLNVWKSAPRAEIAYAVAKCDGYLVRCVVSELRRNYRVVQIFGDKQALMDYCKAKGIKRAIYFDGQPIEISIGGDK